jgi:hypothetical protein
MRLLRLIGKEYTENIGKLVILVILSACLTIGGLFWFIQRDLIYGSVDIFRASGFEDKVIVYNGQFDPVEDLYQRIQSINSLDSVGSVDFCDYSNIYNMINEVDYEYSFEIMKMPRLKFNPYKMISGEAPRQENEIMISSNIKGLQCGDKLYNYRASNYDGKDYTEVMIPCVTVTGVFDINSLMPLAQDKTLLGYDSMSSSEDPTTAYRYGYAFFMDLTDSDNKLLEPTWISHDFVVIPAAGYSTSDVVRELNTQMGIIGYDLTGYKKYAEISHEDDLLKFQTITIVLAVIMITMNVSYCIINLSMRRYEMAIYYVHGLPWKRTVAMSSFMYVIFVMIGYTAGVIIYVSNGTIIKDLSNYRYIFSLPEAITVGALIVGSYILVNLLFYIYTNRKVPVDLLRRE